MQWGEHSRIDETWSLDRISRYDILWRFRFFIGETCFHLITRKNSLVRPCLMIQYSEEKTVVLKILDHQEEHSDMTRWSFKILKCILVYWRDLLVTVFPGCISRYNRFLKIQGNKAVIVKRLAISWCLEQSPSRPCLMIQYNEENTVVLKRLDHQKESPDITGFND